jgi:hypothetical protein
MRLGSFIRASRPKSVDKQRRAQRTEEPSFPSSPLSPSSPSSSSTTSSFRDSTESIFSRHRGSGDADQYGGLWTDLGVLHIQRSLLISLAARENELSGFQGSQCSYRHSSSSKLWEQQSDQLPCGEDVETIRKNVAEMLQMLHFKDSASQLRRDEEDYAI